ncbi:MAG: DUF4911 domain-containing protein [Desulfobulbus sp.]|jgi:hypothetical protein
MTGSPVRADVGPEERIVSFYLLIRSGQINRLRCILEGYDNLALLSTLSVEEGLVRVQTTRSQFAETMRLIAALAPDLTPMVPPLPRSGESAQ